LIIGMLTELAKPDDATEVMQVLTLCIEHMRAQGIQQWDHINPDFRVIESDVRSHSLFVARKSGMCVASVTLDESQPPEYSALLWSDIDGRALMIHRLCVHPQWQQRGIGRRLMDFVEDFAKRHGFSSIRLDAYTGNPQALALYRHRGYRKVGQVYFPRRSTFRLF
jgi:ribosomal protein S18 acetylase RimI-like enzyme